MCAEANAARVLRRHAQAPRARATPRAKTTRQIAALAPLAPLAALALAALCGCGTATTGTPAAAPAHPIGSPHALQLVGLNSAPPSGLISVRLDIPGVGLAFARVVRYQTRADSATITGSVQPADAAVLVESTTSPIGGHRAGLREQDAAVHGGRLSFHALLQPGDNTFNVIALKPGYRAEVTQAIVTSLRPGLDAALQAETQQADQTNAPITIKPGAPGAPTAGQGAGGAVLQQSAPVLAAPGFNAIHMAAPPATGGPGRWLTNFEITEYYPIPESLFSGPFVIAPGLTTPHRRDWLYGPRGVVLEGDGIGLDGRFYHVVDITPPYTFAPGPSRPLTYYRSLAVDPSVIPFGSYVYIPAYRNVNGGWFQADDTGGAIIGNHVDVFRPPPTTLSDEGNLLQGQPVYVVAP